MSTLALVASSRIHELQDIAEASVVKHDAIRETYQQMGAKRQALHARLGIQIKGSVAYCDLLRKIELLDIERGRVFSTLNTATRERQRADVDLQAALFGMRDGVSPVVSVPPRPAPVAPPPAPVLPMFNAAQVDHLRLLGVRVRDTELRSVARLKAALDYVSIVDSALRGGVR
jgi:hypothetical protein